MMAKKRYSLYLTPPLARKFELVARQRHGSRSALFEEALRANLEPQQVPVSRKPSPEGSTRGGANRPAGGAWSGFSR